MSRCRDIQGRLRALIDGELEPRENREALLHLEGCSACRAEHQRMSKLVAAMQAQPLEEPPAHFSTSLQVRLARHRRNSPERSSGWRSWFRVPELPRWRLVSGFSTVAIALIVAILLSRGISADEIARRAKLSWGSIRNYACVFVSEGRYRGQSRIFQQEQYYQKPGRFRLDTSQDYPLTTYVYPDRVIHYLPGGDWKSQGPLAIVRPRREDEEALPFPFGVTWKNGGSVSLDQLIDQLSASEEAKLVGTEKVGELACYRLKFYAAPTPGSALDEYEMWIDRESFLPRRVRWKHDADNEIVTEARDLRINDPLLRNDTFEFHQPAGTVVIEGDVDPHVFALPFLPQRREDADTRPIAAARVAAYERSTGVTFPVYTPEWLPSGFQLVRARRKLGKWVDVHWVRQLASEPAQILKLVEHAAGSEPQRRLSGSTEVTLGDGIKGRMLVKSAPFPHVYLEWDRGSTRCSLFGTGITAKQALRVARSLALVGPEPPSQPDPVVAITPRYAPSEPSALPDPVPTPSGEPAATTTVPPAEEPTPAPPMMPDMPDMQ